MNYYFIYSAGGGAGDWNGIKRVWNENMPVELKNSILLKFGDVFFNHVSSKSILRPERWSTISNLREWLYNDVNDEYVLNDSNILLDTGSAKIVGWIDHHNKIKDCDQLIKLFDDIVTNNNILEKYVDIIIQSNITHAITFDIPNPFKIRTQVENTRLNILNTATSNHKLIMASAKYANKMFELLEKRLGTEKAESILMTTINGMWSPGEVREFLALLNYTPKKIAIGGLSSVRGNSISTYIPTLEKLDLHSYEKIHFLGCGGLDKIRVLKQAGFSNDNFSVDVSTPINRSIDGNKQNTSWSGYYDYNSLSLHRIKPDTKNEILSLHSSTTSPLFSKEQMEKILTDILTHQDGNSSESTYDSRAKLIIHNNDVYRRYAKK